MKIILALSMLALSAGAWGQQKLLKCVAKGGAVTYASTCPEGTVEQQTGIRGSAPAGSAGTPPAAPKSLVERDAAFKKRMIEQQEAQQKDARESALAAQKREACENARAYLAAVQGGQRLTRTDPKTGERAYLNDAERTAEEQKARARIAQSCN
ncbi:MAG: hypothetical protein IT529_13480 [Burkholderiales bacterium]|nr:hypothetical protein [Burkholderiales bacterium]